VNVKNIPKYVQLLLGMKANEQLGFQLLMKLAKRLVPNYRFTWPELDWFQNPKLTEVLKRFDENEGFNAHRRFALQQLLRLTSNIPGDTAECGVYKGCGSYIILNSNKVASFDRVHHIFDSFEGLSNPVEKDSRYWNANDLSFNEEFVKKNLFDFSNVNFYRGWIPKRFDEVRKHNFSFVHVDVDLYEPTLDSIKFFYERINTGGVFVCDDYGFLTCPGATAAMDEFLLSKQEKMIFLPGGGGFFIKGCMTAQE
jgi:O-methyltransferase